MNGPYSIVDSGKFSSLEFGPFITVRENVMADDAGNPANYDNCFDLTGYEFIEIFVKLSGTSPEWDITPLFGQDEADHVFHEGQRVTVNSNLKMTLSVLGAKYFYFRCDGSSGTSPKIDRIRIRPFNVVRYKR